MNLRTLRIIEYNKIVEMLTEYAASPMAKRKCQRIKPRKDIVMIEELQQETRDALMRLNKKGNLSFAGLKDIGASLMRLEMKGSLSSKELLDIASVLDTTLAARQYDDSDPSSTSQGNAEEINADCLHTRFAELVPLEHISREIHRCIVSENEIADDASTTLKNIRRNKKLTNDRLHNQLSKMISDQNNQTMFQDNLITMRNGRYCIPVKNEYKNKFPGMIHDQSSSGSTVFIEPMAIVNMNNELKELDNQEILEIEKILENLSAMAARDIEYIKYNFNTLAELDFIFARAKFARSYKGSEPIFNTDGIVDIRQGRHPLLDRHTVVPVDIRLGEDYNLLIITGPNTGGKTVALKTCGLLTLMAMSGMLIPAAEGSRISVFNNVLADIGDTQSIEQNLSTFSAHMRSVIEILEQADRHSLVLLDELGSGTDPIEGAALAEAVIQRLKDNGAKLMVTTHYQELKLYATEQPDVQNASCEFDIETLRPTYRLILGSPGKSNAFAICKGLGLSESIIAAAETLVSQENLRFEEAVSKLEETRKALEQDRSAMQEALRQAEEDAAKLREEVQRTRTDRENIMEQARLEAMRIVETTKAQSNEMISELDQLRKAKEKATFGDDVIRAKGNVKRGFRKMYETANPLTEVPDEDYVLPRELQVGDTVMLTDTKQKAVVAGKPDKNGTVFLQIGAMRTKVPQEKLRLVAGAEEKKKSQQKQRQTAGRVSAQAARRGTMELDIRGCTCDEGVYQMDAFLDRAVMSHIATVTIIHGKGTGLLRKAIHQRLKQLKYVKNFRLGTFGEGEDGVTIVSLE